MKNVYLSSEAHESLKNYLTEAGYTITDVHHDCITYYPVCTHPDIFMCRLGVWENPAIFPGNPAKLQSKYPGNIIYNAVCTSEYFIHNLKYSDPELLTFARKWKSENDSYKDLISVDVPQGYTRCCLLPVDDTSFITSDHGIAKALIAAGADVLIIEKGHIQLTGFNYGFIGGCAGHIICTTGTSCSNNTDAAGSSENMHRAIIFNGNLSAHPDYEAIMSFINERNIDVIYFKNYPLTDIGSILALW